MSGRWVERHFTVRSPRHALAIAEWTIAAIFVMSAYGSNNPASVVLCLIPVPFLAVAAFAEIRRALSEESP